MEKCLNGRVVSDKILCKLKEDIQRECTKRVPKVAFIRVGEDGASVSYVNQKRRTAAQVGIESELHVLDSRTTSFTTLISLIETLNADKNIHGILVQAPLPGGLDFNTVCNHISKTKDVDGFSEFHLGKLLQEDESGFVSCTPAGIIELLKYYNIETAGKHVVVLNRSLIVGKPLGLLLLRKGSYGNATVTFAHSQTTNLAKITQEADILITACGRPKFITPQFIKEGVVVIDVGITRVPDPSKSNGYSLCGDVDYGLVYPMVSKITPVPGGVGPLTVAMLMYNTFKAYRLQNVIC